MSKRQQNFTNAEGRELEDDNDYSAENLKPALASQEVMAKRKVIKPRSFKNKAVKSAGSGTASSESSGANAFSLFGNSNSKLTGGETASHTESTNSTAATGFGFGSSAANPFSKFGASNSNSNNGSASSAPGIFGSKPSNGAPLFGFQSAKSSTADASSNLFSMSKPSTPAIFENESEQLVDNKSRIIASKLKALNENFMEKITLNFKNAPLADLSVYCKKYLEYMEKINNKKSSEIKENSSVIDSQKPAFSTVPKVIATTNSEAVETKDAESSDDDNDSKQKIEIKGPSFQLDTSKLSSKPASSFRFGKKPKQKKVDDSDSDEDYSIPKGPSFSLSDISKKATTSNTFTWGNKISTDNGNKSSYNFGETNIPDSKTQEVTPASSFKFGAAKTETVKSTPLVDGSKKEDVQNDDKESKPSPFSMNSNEKDKEKKITTPFSFNSNAAKPFSFGNSATKSGDNKNSSTGFKFGASSSAPFGNKSPAFGFGANGENSKKDNKDSEPSFKFGATSNATKTTPFSFTSSASESSEKKNTQTPFKFGSNNETKPTGSDEKKPIFGFTTSSKKEDTNSATESTPKFTFGSSTNTTKPLFSFDDSQKKDEKSSPFGKNESASEKPSLFSFSSSDNTATGTKPAFSFGGTKSNTDQTGKSLFSTENPTSEPPKGSTETGNSSTFSFGTASAPSTNTAFKFGSSVSNGSAAKTTDSSLVSVNKDSENKDEKKTETNEEATPPNPEDVVGKGEENETVRFSARSKYLVLENGSYVTKGVGNLKVLTDKDTKKSRLILRTEGNSNVCLNSYILKDAKYVLDGKINVRVPVMNVESKKLEMNVVKVKDGKGLIAVIEKCQSEM